MSSNLKNKKDEKNIITENTIKSNRNKPNQPSSFLGIPEKYQDYLFIGLLIALVYVFLGGAIFGNCVMGNCVMAITPNNNINIEITMDNMGLSINFKFILISLFISKMKAFERAVT